MSRPRAIVISPESPFPTHGGGAIRTASLLTYLAGRYDVDLVLFRQAGDSDPALSLPEGLVSRSVTVTLPFHSRGPMPWFLRNFRRWAAGAPPLLDRFSGHGQQIAGFLAGQRYEAGLIEHFWCSPYIAELEACCGHVVLDLHNVESAWHTSCAKADRWPVSGAHHRFSKACKKLERHWLPRFESILVTSQEDALRVVGKSRRSGVTIYPNAIPAVPVPDVTEDHAIGFSGNLEYHPNVAAVRYLTEEIWPRLQEKDPTLELRLIGKKPEAVAKWTAGVAGLRVTGPVEDAVAELARVKVVVVPLLSGSGTRLKILEAWAANRAVVSTPIGAEGLGAREGRDILLAGNPDHFANRVWQLLCSESDRGRIGSAGRATYERSFTWDAAWSKLNGVL